MLDPVFAADTWACAAEHRPAIRANVWFWPRVMSSFINWTSSALKL